MKQMYGYEIEPCVANVFGETRDMKFEVGQIVKMKNGVGSALEYDKIIGYFIETTPFGSLAWYKCIDCHGIERVGLRSVMEDGYTLAPPEDLERISKYFN